MGHPWQQQQQLTRGIDWHSYRVLAGLKAGLARLMQVQTCFGAGHMVPVTEGFAGLEDCAANVLLTS